jgi:hypothetical protein
MSKVECPKCEIKNGYWRWAVWKDLSGRTFRCPHCASLFYLKSETHPFLNKQIWYVFYSFLLGGITAAIVGIVIILLLETFGGNKVLFLMSIPAALLIAGYLAGMIVNKFFILEDRETHQRKE